MSKIRIGIVGYGNVGRGAERSIARNEDMELVAVYAVSQNYNIPAVGIKIMSDNELLGEEYEPAVGSFVQEYTYEVLKELVDNIEKFNV